MKVKIDHIPPLILQNNFHFGKEHKNESQSRESLGGVICALRRREGGRKGTLQGEDSGKHLLDRSLASSVPVLPHSHHHHVL